MVQAIHVLAELFPPRVKSAETAYLRPETEKTAGGYVEHLAREQQVDFGDLWEYAVIAGANGI